MERGEPLFTKEHTWVKVEEDDTAIIGLSHVIVEELEEISHIELPEVGIEVEQMETIATVEGLNDIFDICSPVSGKIIEINTSLIDEPNLIVEDPYGDGWIAIIKLSDKEELSRLMPEEEYREYVNSIMEIEEEYDEEGPEEIY
ncbi:MAG: glycine cleavage system protein GcvH [Thermosulfidibacteraceae bacterium]|jgi:glycine cleavage system H protein